MLELLAGTNCSVVIFFPIISLDTLPVFSGSMDSNDVRGGAEVRFITLEKKTEFHKKQCRIGGVTQQRVVNGKVEMEARSPVSQILKIRVWVFREAEAADLHRDRNGLVELPVEYGNQDIDKVGL